jgi:hypothetical protein
VNGHHGTGTRALKLLLRDMTALRQVTEALGNGRRAFQVVAEVGDIVHGWSGSLGRRLRVQDVVELPDSDEVWQRARVAVARRFSDWAAEESRRNVPYPHERR